MYLLPMNARLFWSLIRVLITGLFIITTEQSRERRVMVRVDMVKMFILSCHQVY